MEKTYDKVTFQPISRGRFRCNQTGEIVSRSKTKGRRIALLNAGKKNKPPKTYTYPGKVAKYSTIYCPVCHRSISVGSSSGMYECREEHRVQVTIKTYYWE